MLKFFKLICIVDIKGLVDKYHHLQIDAIVKKSIYEFTNRVENLSDCRSQIKTNLYFDINFLVGFYNKFQKH